jgi:hypothetical protein
MKDDDVIKPIVSYQYVRVLLERFQCYSRCVSIADGSPAKVGSIQGSELLGADRIRVHSELHHVELSVADCEGRAEQRPVQLPNHQYLLPCHVHHDTLLGVLLCLFRHLLLGYR